VYLNILDLNFSTLNSLSNEMVVNFYVLEVCVEDKIGGKFNGTLIVIVKGNARLQNYGSVVRRK